MYALVVAVTLAIGGVVGPPEVTPGPFQYNAAIWPTKDACDAFVASDAGKQSLDQLRAAVKEQVNDQVTITLTAECKPVQ